MQYILRRLESAKCFLWDFDGCFADTEKLHFMAYAKAFAQFGHVLKEAEYYPSFTHLGDGTRREIEANKLPISEQAVLGLKSEIYRQLISEMPVKCFAETLELVQLMRRLGAKVAIASNSSEEEIQIILSRAGFPVHLLHTIVGKSQGLRKKPAPDIFLHALARLECTSENAFVLEDSNRGLQAAAAAHCPALWMRTDYNANLESKEPHVASLTHMQLRELLMTGAGRVQH